MRIVVALTLAAVTAAAAPSADRDGLVRGNTAFAFDLYRRQPAGNVFFSPYSISTAMAMAGAGARGATATEIEGAMHFPFGGARLAEAWPALLDNDSELVTANALWPARRFELRAAYVAMAKNGFGARIETLDFAHDPVAASRTINAWVSDTTRQRIQNLVRPDSFNAGTRMVLTNAIYMKAKWVSPFDPDRTNQNGRFHAPGGAVTVPLMYQVSYFRYYHGDGVKVLELPYEGYDLAMLIVLPDARDGLAAVERSLTPQTLARWERKLTMRRVSLALPRFSSEIGLEVGPMLEAMGIRIAFDTHGAADFSGISDKEKLAISRVVHKARIDVTEEGTEAAAATSVEIMVGSAAPFQEPPPEIFHADHPFFFVIRRTTSKSILFMGRLVKP